MGSLGNFTDSEALAVDPNTNGIYVVDNSRLVRLHPLTGNGTLVGNIGFSDVDGTAFSPLDGRLYGVTYGSNKILRIDLVTGQGTVVANDVLVGNRLNDLAFHTDGRAFILTGGSPKIYQVDIPTGQKLGKRTVSDREQLLGAAE